jgi:hypothetical protein
MKKTVQIVTIPLNKKRWSEGDLLFDNTNKEYSIAIKSCIDVDWQAQQLLVLSDDEIQSGDSFLEKDITEGFDKAIISRSGGCIPRCWVKKIIASYPQIEGTLPISKETIQAWIDAGTPGEGSVDMLYWCKNGDSLSGCEKQTHCNCSDNTEPDVDRQGNLLLEFPISAYDGVDFEPIKPRNSKLIHKSIDKPSIPTDEEIEKKAEESATEWLAGSFNTELHDEQKEEWAKQDYCCGYEEGYKQALKDLGYE